MTRYRLRADYHTHTRYSRHNHGKSTMEENVRAAVAAGLEAIAISDHGPGHRLFGMDARRLPEMKAEIERLRAAYPEIRIYFCVESNLMDRGPWGNHLDLPKSAPIGRGLESHRGTVLLCDLQEEATQEDSALGRIKEDTKEDTKGPSPCVLLCDSQEKATQENPALGRIKKNTKGPSLCATAQENPALGRIKEDTKENTKGPSLCATVKKNTKGPSLCAKSQQGQFDFLLAGYHLGMTGCHAALNWIWSKKLWRGKGFTERLRERNTRMTLAAIYENDITILTHPGDKGPLDMDAVAAACGERGILMEISAWHSHLNVEEIRIAAKYDVSFVIDSDAHRANRVGTLGGAVERALEAGLDLERIVNLEVID